MSWLVLDPMSGGLNGRLFQISPDGSVERGIPLGYSAEVRFQPHTAELVILESAAVAGAEMRYQLRVLDAANLRETARREIPVRPMYAGFPGRSVAGSMSPGGRYVYFLRSGPVIEYGEDLVFRLTPVRWDRVHDKIEIGAFHIDSCIVDCGLTGGSDEELFLHLSCECASMVAFGSFRSSGSHFLRMEDLPRREHAPLETTSSWLDSATRCLYCVNRAGTIYEVRLREKTSRVLASLGLTRGRAVPVHQVCGSSGEVHVGVAEDEGDMGLGMVTEIWSVSTPNGDFLGRRTLPRPVMNFVVTADGQRLAGVDPYTRTVFCMARASGEDIWVLRDLGATPAELIAIP